MTDLPEPMVPPECDLRGLEWMPLYGDRLFSSETWLEASAEARCAAISLWWAAWKQRPAGSLANSDRVLAQLAGYGTGIKGWLAIKGEAMRGWIECSDGRLYHPVVCELALEAWQRRQDEREKKQRWRDRKNGGLGGSAPGSPVTTGSENGSGNGGSSPPDEGDGTVLEPGRNRDATGTEPGRNGSGTGTRPGQDRDGTVLEPGQDRSRDGDGTVLEPLTGQDRTKKERKNPPHPSGGPPPEPRGLRLPADWQPSPAMLDFAQKRGLDGLEVAGKFRDYWHAKAGKDARKVNWEAQWRFWCSNETRGRPAADNRSKLAWMVPQGQLLSGETIIDGTAEECLN